MAHIAKLTGLEIFDSRGVPTLEVHCVLDNGIHTSASVPSGAVVSKYEASPVAINAAISNIETIILPSLTNQSIEDLRVIDNMLVSLDGTPTKQGIGGNTVLGVSIAIARAIAEDQKKSLIQLLTETYGLTPVRTVTPMFNIINGGAHADNNLTFQEFMVVPLIHEQTFKEKVNQGRLIFQALKKRLEQLKKSTNVGDEGGFAPELNSNEEAIEILVEVIQEAGFRPGTDVGIALDIAASTIPDLHVATYPKPPLEYYKALINDYPIISLEDPFGEDLWDEWATITSTLGDRIALVGDDLFTTNKTRLQMGIQKKAANAISIKPNQIGTISETIETILLAKQAGMQYQVSHRAGETEDTFIADLSLACGAMYLKAGAPNRGERIAKYNQMIRLETL